MRTPDPDEKRAHVRLLVSRVRTHLRRTVTLAGARATGLTEPVTPFLTSVFCVGEYAVVKPYPHDVAQSSHAVRCRC